MLFLIGVISLIELFARFKYFKLSITSKGLISVILLSANDNYSMDIKPDIKFKLAIWHCVIVKEVSMGIYLMSNESNYCKFPISSIFESFGYPIINRFFIFYEANYIISKLLNVLDENILVS